MERLFNILRGVVVASYLDREAKKELLDFLTKLEAEQALARMEKENE